MALLLLALGAVLDGFLYRMHLNRRLVAELTWTEGDDYKRSLAAIRELTREGADINTRGADGATPLIWAARAGDVRWVEELLRRGARVNARSAEGETALGHGARVSVHLTQLLLRNGADVRSRDWMEKTPLHLAACSGRRDPDVIRVLLAAGADPNARSRGGETPLHQAVIMGSPPCIRALAEGGAALDAIDDQGETPLIRAITYRRPSVVAALLGCGADPEAYDRERYTALARAAMAPNEALLRVLLERGASVATPVTSERCTVLSLRQKIRYSPGPMEAQRMRIIRLLEGYAPKG